MLIKTRPGSKIRGFLVTCPSASTICIGETYETENIPTVMLLNTYQEHYYDMRLDVFADTYEAAIIAFASKVDTFFYPDGTKREGVAYEKSERELSIEESLCELQEERPSWSIWSDSLPRIKFEDYGRWVAEQEVVPEVSG